MVHGYGDDVVDVGQTEDERPYERSFRQVERTLNFFRNQLA